MRYKHKLIVHPSCPSSKSILERLVVSSLFEKVEVIIIDTPSKIPTGIFPWAIPFLLSPEGTPLAMDPLDWRELESIVESNWEWDGRSDEEQFVTSVLYSAYASATALVHGGFDPLLTSYSFIAPALRTSLRGIEVSEISDKLRRDSTRLYLAARDKIARALSIALVRFLFYGGLREPEKLKAIDVEQVSALVLAMASIGRGMLPLKPRRPDMVEQMVAFIRRGAVGLLRRVEMEHKRVYTPEYVELIERLARKG
ncbi:MAG: hypothetical protein F7C35_03905 [Desulfurococcales archaeon]|nr:hypothetical protein [Desulfurococcales archaeon]